MGWPLRGPVRLLVDAAGRHDTLRDVTYGEDSGLAAVRSRGRLPLTRNVKRPGTSGAGPSSLTTVATAQPISSQENQTGWFVLYHSSTERIAACFSRGITFSSTRSR